ncbi:hypothetical protein JEODO184_01104 [Jeotgalicoccus meleagridis]|jgi:hypothetical protein|uniref:Uncharacterized protein n=1 Tax=Jeotgalicoccus meleagridis TaxID=2759181 RepID=A0A6V7RGG3_9STAP|nr:hypothetical protein JEODO184_01104 [Jeotgalicoccus meleagridis]
MKFTMKVSKTNRKEFFVGLIGIAIIIVTTYLIRK